MPRRNENTPAPKNKILLTDEERAYIRRMNRQRAKLMERQVMRELGATRTERSGAGYIKADGFLQLPYNLGLALIECKVSAAINDQKGPAVAFAHTWVEKLQNDVKATAGLGARFGFFVIKWHSWREKIVLLNTLDIPLISELFDVEIKPTHTLVLGFKDNGLPLRYTFLYHREMVKNIGAEIEIPTGKLYITTIEHMKEIIVRHDEH